MPRPVQEQSTQVHRATVRELASVLLQDVEGLADELVAVLVTLPAAYAGRHAVVATHDLRASCEANMRRILQSLAGLAGRDDEILDAPQRTGHLRAEQRVPLEAVLRSYRVGGRVIWDGLVRELHSRPQGNAFELLDAATDVWAVIDDYSQAVGDAYRDREAELQQRDQQLRAAVLGALLEGHYDGPVARAADALGLPVTGPFVCVTAPLGASGELPVVAASGLASAWGQRGSTVVGIVHLPDRHGIDVLRGALSSNPLRCGVSMPFAGLSEAREGLRWATIALRTLPGEAVHPAWLDERLPEALLVESPDLAARLLVRTLGPVLDLPEPERTTLLETIEALVRAGGSATLAAGPLYCHRNTVLNRMQRIETLLGHTFKDMRFISSCVLALAVLDGR